MDNVQGPSSATPVTMSQLLAKNAFTDLTKDLNAFKKEVGQMSQDEPDLNPAEVKTLLAEHEDKSGNVKVKSFTSSLLNIPSANSQEVKQMSTLLQKAEIPVGSEALVQPSGGKSKGKGAAGTSSAASQNAPTVKNEMAAYLGGMIAQASMPKSKKELRELGGAGYIPNGVEEMDEEGAELSAEAKEVVDEFSTMMEQVKKDPELLNDPELRQTLELLLAEMDLAELLE
jgi:hypothetical protein